MAMPIVDVVVQRIGLLVSRLEGYNHMGTIFNLKSVQEHIEKAKFLVELLGESNFPPETAVVVKKRLLEFAKKLKEKQLAAFSSLISLMEKTAEAL